MIPEFEQAYLCESFKCGHKNESECLKFPLDLPHMDPKEYRKKQNREYYEKHKEKFREYARDWRLKNKERYYEIVRKSQLKDKPECKKCIVCNKIVKRCFDSNCHKKCMSIYVKTI